MYRWCISMGVPIMISAIIAGITTPKLSPEVFAILLIIFMIGLMITIYGIIDWIEKPHKFKGIPKTDKEKKKQLKQPKPDWKDFNNLSDKDFIENIYERVFCREVDPMGLQTYMAHLKDGMTRKKFIDIIWKDDERIELKKKHGLK